MPRAGSHPTSSRASSSAAVVDSSPFDVTFPALSLATGQRVTERIQESADGLDIEDGWRNFFCVSTNLTTGEHRDPPHRVPDGTRSGPASRSPGVFPPVRSADG